MKRERIKKYKNKKMSAMILAALLMGTVVQAEPVNNGDTKVHYFSVKSEETGEKSNFDSNGAKGDESMVIGIGSTSEGNNSTVIGNNNKLTGNKEIKKDDKVVSLNNSIVAGQNLEVDGYSNTVFATEAIDDMRFQRQTKVAGDHNTVIGAGNLVGYKEGKTRQTYTKLGNGISSNKNVVIGSQLTVSGSDNVVLGYLTEFEVGADAVTTIGSANHIGRETQEGVAIGNNLGINGQSTVAIGFASEATAKSAISIGQFNTAEGENAISIGNESHAYAKNSIAIGGPVTEGPPGTGIPGASATVEGGVALGAGSVADRKAGMAGYLSDGNDTAEWRSTLGALSVGAEFDEGAATRQITGVAAGTKDTDAVNVAQLKALNTKMNQGAIHYYSVTSDKKAAGSNFDNDGAKADDSMVIGIGSTSNGINSTVVGNNNALKGGKRDSDGVHRNNSIVVGESIEVEGTHNAVFGTDYMNGDRKLTKVAGEQNTVIGVGNLVGYTAEKDLSDPRNPKWTYTKLYDRGSDANVAIGMTNTVNGGSVVLGTSSEIKDGATLATSVGHANTIQGSEQYGVALGNNLLVEGYGAIAVGTDSKATADYATAIGTEAVAEQEDSIAFGDAAKAQNKYSIAFGSFATAKAGSGVAIGSSSLADREKGAIGYLAGENTSEVWKATRGAVSVGNKEKKYTRQITGVAAGTEDTDAVNVAQLKAATKNITDSIKDTTLEANNNALSLDGSKLNLSVKDTAGNEVKGSVDLNAIKSVVDTNTYTTGGTYDAATKKLKFTQNDPAKNYEIDVSAMLNDVVDTDTRNTILESDTVKVDATNTNQDGSINYKLNVKTDGKVEKDNKGVINGGTVYKETRIEKDGNYIKAGNTAGENLIALDKQVGVNSTNITKLENNIYDMGTRVGELDNRMNKAGAGAAALAALHPLDFDPDDKWDIAAGIGNYKNATAAAVGFFYRPNERTMLNLGWTMGDNRNMVNGGFSIKLGSGANISTSKTAMAREIRTLRDVVSQQNEQIERQNRKIEKQEREMKEVLEILAEMRKDKK